MKHLRTALIATGLAAASFAFAASTASADQPSCNWGQVTAEAIADGFDQGGHASNQANPRVGLANVVSQGDLNATCTLLS